MVDEVSARINRLLSTKTFSFSPAELISIHRALFTGILDRKIAGKIRDYDITKDEPILNGDTVIYGRADSIRETLEYDFAQEKKFNYKGLSKREIVDSWQNLLPVYGKFTRLVKVIPERQQYLSLNTFILWDLRRLMICLRRTQSISVMRW